MPESLLPRLRSAGVLTISDWSVKVWRQIMLPYAFRVQVEHYESDRGGWIRYQLANFTLLYPVLQSFSTLEDAQRAAVAFLVNPSLDQCAETT